MMQQIELLAQQILDNILVEPVINSINLQLMIKLMFKRQDHKPLEQQIYNFIDMFQEKKAPLILLNQGLCL